MQPACDSGGAGEQPDLVWSLDFVSDALAWGRRLRMLTVVDTYTRESLPIEVDHVCSAEQASRGCWKA